MYNLIKKIENFIPKKITIIGDLILDKYTFGSCKRISPEADVLILKQEKEEYNLGGAGNTSLNVKTLDCEPFLIGIIGKDKEGEYLKNELTKNNIFNNSGVIIAEDIDSKTLLKERCVARNQLLRIDRNDFIKPNKKNEEKIYNKFLEVIETTDIFIISDYAKGTLSGNLIQKIIKNCEEKNKILIIDPRPSHYNYYKGKIILTPNLNEACKMANISIDNSNIEQIKNLAKTLYDNIGVNSKIILTLSDKGIYYYNKENTKHFSTYKRQIRDVSGAGDTVAAALAVGLSNNLDIEEAILFANHAGGVAVEKSGVQPVYLKEIIQDIKEHNNIK